MNDWEFRKYRPKRPPPEDGIKAKKAGTTWWGQRWLDALERMSSAYGLRLARGRTYARAGRTHDLVVSTGQVTARVTGSAPKPYAVTLTLSALSDATWSAAIAALAQKAQFAAELLAGQMPKEIDDVFRASGASLFPADETDLQTKCSCPDWANPCKHVAATHYVLGEALDRDPFLLFELRGRSKERVLSALRAARTGSHTEEAVEHVVPSVTLTELSAADYDRPRAELTGLHLGFDPPDGHGALIAQLGEPAAWSGDASVTELLAPLLRAAAERARNIALSDETTAQEAGLAEKSNAETRAASARQPQTHKASAKRAGSRTTARPAGTRTKKPAAKRRR